MRVEDVFTPDDDPSVTYVARTDQNIEQTLQDISRVSKFVISISGPSKAGKSVAVRRVFGDHLIPVSGANVTTPEDIWHRALDWMDVPSTVTQTAANATTGSGGVNFGLIAKGSYTEKDSITETRQRSALSDIIEEIAGSEFVVFVDDFHYIDRAVQEAVSKQIKTATEAGVKIISASVPHRSEDLLRANPELRGRLSSVDISYWNKDELKKIAYQGFKELNLDIDDSTIQRIANEACGSPQLMQAICLFFCYEIGATETGHETNKKRVSKEVLDRVLERTTIKCNFSDLVTKLHGGPKTRGTERKVFEFADGSAGDVYRAVLLGLSRGEPRLELEYSEIVDRIKQICRGTTPVGSSIAEACKQLANISEALAPGARVVDWDEDYEVLSLSDPYLLYFIRCSNKLPQLGQMNK
jgi:hypothetical protein